MTKKTATKTAARARQAARGGKYNVHLRHVGGGSSIQIIQKSPDGAPSRLGTGTSRDPLQRLDVELRNGVRTVLLVALPKAEEHAAWSAVVFHENGPWPLLDSEQAALDNWLEGVARKHWPERQLFAPPRYLDGKPLVDWPGKERWQALTAVYGTSGAHDLRRGRASLDLNRGSQAWLAQWVHIEGTRLDNTTWRLSNERDGSKVQLGLPEPITRKVIEDAFHLEICPLTVETSEDGGFSWSRCPDDCAKWDWRASLAKASSELLKLRHNAVRVVSRTRTELVRYHRPDIEHVPLYDLEARIIMRALERTVTGTQSSISRSGPPVPTTKFTHTTEAGAVIHVVLFNGAIWCRATTESAKEIWRGEKHPLNEENAHLAASELVARFGPVRRAADLEH